MQKRKWIIVCCGVALCIAGCAGQPVFQKTAFDMLKTTASPALAQETPYPQAEIPVPSFSAEQLEAMGLPEAVSYTHLDVYKRQVQRAMPSKSPMPALEGVLFVAKENAVSLTCSDLALSIECSLPANIQEEGALVLPGRMFAELIRKMPPDLVSISTDGLKVTIECGQAKYNLQGMDAREYPEMPPMTGARPLELKQSALKNMIQRTAFAVARCV